MLQIWKVLSTGLEHLTKTLGHGIHPQSQI